MKQETTRSDNLLISRLNDLVTEKNKQLEAEEEKKETLKQEISKQNTLLMEMEKQKRGRLPPYQTATHKLMQGLIQFNETILK